MGKAVLIVEDEPVNLRLFHDLLERRGYTVIVAGDGGQAVELAMNQKPGLILMDVGLPGMNGLEATRIIKGDTATRNIPIIALTAYAMKEDEEKAAAAGCDRFITKPVDIKELLKEVAEYLPLG